MSEISEDSKNTQLMSFGGDFNFCKLYNSACIDEYNFKDACVHVCLRVMIPHSSSGE